MKQTVEFLQKRSALGHWNRFGPQKTIMGGTVFKVAVLVSYSDLNFMMEQVLVGIRARKFVNSGTGIYRIPTERRPGIYPYLILITARGTGFFFQGITEV